MEYTKQCSARVSHDDWGHTHQCEKRAVVERNGKAYCKIHDPEYIKAKNAKRTAKFDKEWAEEKAYSELQNTAVRACKKINPDNPMAVAQSIKDLYEALKDLPRPKSLLESAAYTGGDVPKQWIAEHSQFIDGYNQALKDVAKMREQALAKAQ